VLDRNKTLNGISGGGAKKNMKNFNRNLKAISPIFATLILIAIAVIAGVVVYMFTSGTLATMTGGGTAAQEKAAVQGASGTGTAGAPTGAIVYAQYMGGGNPISINGALFNDASGATVPGTLTATPLPVAGTLTAITITGTLVTGHTYTVTLTSAKGGSFVSPSFVAP
jgi:archaeal type IV pilus assembly protein PilA